MSEVKKPVAKNSVPKKKPIDYSDLFKEMEKDVIELGMKLGYLDTKEGLSESRKQGIIDYLLKIKEA